LRGPLRRAEHPPLAVDLGFGAWPVTTVELADRLAVVRPDVRVIGLEIDPGRVAQAAAYARENVEYAYGGFELGPVASRGDAPLLIRAFNVLRQYDESEVGPAWRTLTSTLAPDGMLVEGTCDEVGRRATWVRLGGSGIPDSLTFAARLADLQAPSQLAERLPKALIHRNVPGEAIHGFLLAWDQVWARAADRAVFGARQRWVAVAGELKAQGWPVLDGPARWRLGELTVAWEAVAPR
jgi:hypothetical protein